QIFLNCFPDERTHRGAGVLRNRLQLLLMIFAEPDVCTLHGCFCTPMSVWSSSKTKPGGRRGGKETLLNEQETRQQHSSHPSTSSAKATAPSGAVQTARTCSDRWYTKNRDLVLERQHRRYADSIQQLTPEEAREVDGDITKVWTIRGPKWIACPDCYELHEQLGW